MHAPFPSLGLNNSHLQGPQDAMKVSTKASSTPSPALRLITLSKAIYKKYPMGFLLPIVQAAPLSVELPPDTPAINPTKWKVTECFSNAEFHDLIRGAWLKSHIFKHIITLRIKLTTRSGIRTLTPSTDPPAQRERLENQLASDLKKLAYVLRYGHFAALKHLVCHVDRTSSPDHDADPKPLKVDKDCFFKLGMELEAYHGFQAVLYSEEKGYYLVVARKYPQWMHTS